ncbi:MAG: DUF1499 domain-containing protein [Marinosulfonomonas sp.]
MKIALLLLVLLLGAGISYIRLTPVDPTAWHVDPVTAEIGPAGHKITLETHMDPTAALLEIEQIALSTPRTKILAGSAQEGRISFVTRSFIWGFPDIATVSATANPSGTAVSFFSRQKVGGYDYGVNKKRIDRWIAKFRSAT